MSFRRARSVVALVAAATLAASCAHVDDSTSAPFSPVPEIGLGLGGPSEPQGPPPLDNPGQDPGQSPEDSSPPTDGSSPPIPPECVDPDPAVIATCLAPTVAVAGLPTEAKAIVAERDTGVMKLVSDTRPPEPYATISPSSGKVVGLALSPDFEQDKLVYAVLARNGSTAIARITEGDKEKIVAENLPAAPQGRAGIGFLDGKLVLGVGTEVLRFPDFAGFGPVGTSERLASLPDPVSALCTPPAGAPGLFATTTGNSGAAVSRVDHGAPIRVWSWPAPASATSCAVSPAGLAVAFPDAERVEMLGMDEQLGSALGAPVPLAEKKYGRLAGVGLLAGNALVATTVNKDGGSPVPTDDRAVLLPISGGTSGDERV